MGIRGLDRNLNGRVQTGCDRMIGGQDVEEKKRMGQDNIATCKIKRVI
jgi:hypothetical protein